MAESFPARSVRIIVPVAAGGPTDVIARLLAQKLSDRWAKPVIVENIPAGAGNMGVSAAAKAPADGHTVVLVTTGFVINPSLYAKLPYDPVKDFAPVSVIAASPHVLIVNPSVPATDLQQLVALVRQNPGKYSYASPGTGQSGQLAGELFKLAFGLDLAHVPFNGGAPAITATIGGHTPIAFMALSTAAQPVKEGKLRALAVTSRSRSTLFPDVPTMAEAGAPDQESTFVQAILCPAGTPQDIVARWHREIADILALPDVRRKLAAMNLEPVVSTPEAFAAWIRTEIPRWGRIIEAANIKKVDQ
jgi:tripartite-type tricarboxylate transporter receptor subunit TctC